QELIAGLKVYRTALEKIKDGNSQPWNYTWRKGNMEYTEKRQQRKRLNFNERYRTTESLTHLMFELAICFKLYFAKNKNFLSEATWKAARCKGIKMPMAGKGEYYTPLVALFVKATFNKPLTSRQV